MTAQELHAEVLNVVRRAVKDGMTAKELHEYLKSAATGMQVNAAFNLKGEDLLAALDNE